MGYKPKGGVCPDCGAPVTNAGGCWFCTDLSYGWGACDA